MVCPLTLPSLPPSIVDMWPYDDFDAPMTIDRDPRHGSYPDDYNNTICLLPEIVCHLHQGLPFEYVKRFSPLPTASSTCKDVAIDRPTIFFKKNY